MTEKRRLTNRGAQRRRQILELATELFANGGYHPTSVSDIVDGLGVGKGVFYWYFDSKEMLFEEILRDSQRDLRRFQLKSTEGAEGPLERMERGIRASVHWSANHRELAKLVDFAQTDGRFSALIRSGRTELASDAVSLIREAMDAELIPPGDPEQLGYAILGVSTSLTTVFLHELERDPEVVADAAVEFCMRGLGADMARSTPTG